MRSSTLAKTNTYTLPPLILHPFSDAGGPAQLLESSRATLMLQGVLPGDDGLRDDLEKKVLEGRYSEIRMLYYVGKDVNRWIDQCLEFVERIPELRGQNLCWQSFARLLTEDTPLPVRHKLSDWGVVDYRALFTRGLGLNTVFAGIPERQSLSDDFVRNYYRFADQMFQCVLTRGTGADLEALGCDFELYASGEYSRMLEREWASQPES
jgi:hypothetical protein